MKSEKLPVPSDLLEELADKVIEAIDGLAVKRFDAALDEMIEYHAFLLDAYSTQTEEGEPFSYAQIDANWFGGPHQQWIREYRRVFDRAVSRIGQETEFATTLAGLPLRLLGARIEKLSPPVVSAVLDLSAILASRLEDWLSRHVSIVNAPGQSASPRLSLAGSDKSAFSDVLFDFIGAWEGVIQFVGSLYKLKDAESRGPDEQWRRLANSWPFLQHHLRNTAYFLALAIWNEDEIGAERFRESLVRWPAVFQFQLADPYYSAFGRYLFPDLFSLSWSEAKAKVNRIEGDDFERGVTPLALGATILRHVHDDALILTSAVLLRWIIGEKQSTNIGAQVATRLLAKELADADDSLIQNDMGFGSIFFELLRIELGGDLHSDEGYGKTLDGFVSSLDQMSERRVVPGRVFTPSTIHGRDDLLIPFAILLVLKSPLRGDENVLSRLSELIKVEERLPRGDRSLFDLIKFLDRFVAILADGGGHLQRPLALISQDENYEQRIGNLREIFTGAIALIKTHRTEKIKALPKDMGALERIRLAGESAIVTSLPIWVFHGFVTEKDSGGREAAVTERAILAGLPKGMFTRPMMEYSWTGLDETIVERIKSLATQSVWQSFYKRKRQSLVVNVEPINPIFWKMAAAFKHQVGIEPVLLLPDHYRDEVLKWLYSPGQKPDSVLIERKSKGERQSGGYIATIEGLDVFSGGIDGNSVLFSSATLKSVRYGLVENENLLQLIPVDEDDPWKMSLKMKFAQLVEWDGSTIIEIKSHRPRDRGLKQ